MFLEFIAITVRIDYAFAVPYPKPPYPPRSPPSPNLPSIPSQQLPLQALCHDCQATTVKPQALSAKNYKIILFILLVQRDERSVAAIARGEAYSVSAEAVSLYSEYRSRGELGVVGKNQRER